MNFSLQKIIACFAISTLFLSCEEEIPPPSFSYTQLFDIDNGVINYFSYKQVPDAHSGNMISRADSGQNFGFGYTYYIPDSLTGKDIFVNINAWVRTGKLDNNCDLVLSVNSKDSCLLWAGCGSKTQIKNPNEWTNVSAQFDIPSKMTSQPNIKLSVLGHNADAKSYFDVDDLILTITADEAN